jgi:Raf kinase inhibitor-like YbhB/YbcL family protein
MFRTSVNDVSLFGGRTAAGPKPSFRPAVEALEERVLLRFTLGSTYFGNGDSIPAEFASAGPYSKNWSPPLECHNAPFGTLSFALIMDDEDVPSLADPNVKEPFNHWVIFNIPQGTRDLRGAIPRDLVLSDPLGAMQGTNENGQIGYLGPNPQPRGSKHNYVFTLYALNTQFLTLPPVDISGEPTPLAAGATKEQLITAMGGSITTGGHIIAAVQLRGWFNRSVYRTSGFMP